MSQAHAIERALSQYEKQLKRSIRRRTYPRPLTAAGVTQQVIFNDVVGLAKDIAEFTSAIGVRRFMQHIGKSVTATWVPSAADFEGQMDAAIVKKAAQIHKSQTRTDRKTANACLLALQSASTRNGFRAALPIEQIFILERVAKLLPHLAAALPEKNIMQELSRPGKLLDVSAMTDMYNGLPFLNGAGGLEFDQTAPDAAKQHMIAMTRAGLSGGGSPDAAAVFKKAYDTTLKVYGLLSAPVFAFTDPTKADEAIFAGCRRILSASILSQISTGGAVTRGAIEDALSEKNRAERLHGSTKLSLGFIMDAIAIGTSLNAAANSTNFDSQTLQDLASATLKSTNLMIGALEAAKLVSKRMATNSAAIIAVPLLCLDGLAAAKNISSAQRRGDMSVAFGEALKLGAAGISTFLTIYAAVVGPAVMSGPVGWAIVLGWVLAIIGDALVSLTVDSELETFATNCVFGKASSIPFFGKEAGAQGSDSPEDINFAFIKKDGVRFRAAGKLMKTDLVDAKRMRLAFFEALNPIGFKVESPGTTNLSWKLSFRHEVDVQQDDGSTKKVSVIPPGVNIKIKDAGAQPPFKFGGRGKAIPGLDRGHLQANGVLTIPQVASVRNHYAELIIDVPGEFKPRGVQKLP